jgi:beta-galactosidase
MRDSSFRSLILLGLSIILTSPAYAQTRERLSLNADWRFQKGDPAEAEGQLNYEKIKDRLTLTGSDFKKETQAPTVSAKENPGGNISYAQSGFDDRGWRQLDLPHDWGIEGPFKQEYSGDTGKLPWWGVGWYRKHFNVAANEKGKRFFLDLDGAMAYAAVWLNGQFVGGWPYGYSSFRLELTPYLKYGAENVIAIRLDNPPESSRWYPGGGIYRNVWLVKTAAVHVGHWGTYITTPEVTRDSATVEIKLSVDNQTAAAANVIVKTQVYELGADGKKTGLGVASAPAATFKIPAGQSQSGVANLSVKQPKLWNLQKAQSLRRRHHA